MNINHRRRVVIDVNDHPEVVAPALDQVVGLFRRENRGRLRRWEYGGPDAHDINMISTLGEYADVLNGNEVITQATPTEFELALVYYGVEHIDDDAKLAKVDELLRRLDLCRSLVDR